MLIWAFASVHMTHVYGHAHVSGVCVTEDICRRLHQLDLCMERLYNKCGTFPQCTVS